MPFDKFIRPCLGADKSAFDECFDILMKKLQSIIASLQ